MIYIKYLFVGLCMYFIKPVVAQNYEEILDNKELFRNYVQNDSIKKELIAFLLSYQGDTEINYTWYGFTNDSIENDYNMRLSFYPPEYNYCTNQFVALYLIEALIQGDVEFCTKVMIVKNKKENITNVAGYYYFNKQRVLLNKYKITDRKDLKKLYFLYRDWFIQWSENSEYLNSSPLEGTEYEWEVF